jgi:SAM-dependent methyltransferase
MSSNQSKDTLREWRESAPYWSKHAGIVRSMFAPITRALIDAADIDETCLVLDVAGGSGEPSLTIADTVTRSDLVICTDAVTQMVLASRREARVRSLDNIEFTQCIGEALPFRSDAFDAVVCRLGIMLFPDPIAAIGEILRVTKPSRRVAFAVWSARSSNPFFHVVANIVAHYVESPPEDPDAPGAFRFAEGGKLARLLNKTGAIEVSERLLDFSLEAPLSPKQFWEVRAELSDTLRGKIAGLSSDQAARLAREVEEAGQAFYKDGRMRFPGQALIVSGRRK